MLSGYPLPEAGAYLWDWFRRFSRHRSSNGMGPSRASWSDIDAWLRVTGLKLMDWELDVIELLDALWYTVMSAKTYTSDFMKELEEDRG